MKKENETKREKFLRLANARTNKILEMISLLGNLGNTSNYEYTNDDVEKIFKAIEHELKDTKKKFTTNIYKTKKFNLGDE